MERPRRFLTRMVIFLAVAGTVAVLLLEQLIKAFEANPPLNGLILGVLAIGIVFCFRQILRLIPEMRWIESFRTNQPGLSTQAGPRLLSPMARMLTERKGRVTLTAPAMRSLLDSIASRLEESRDLSRYLIGLLIFLGLLGTFWGLLDTVGSVGNVIRDLAIADDEIVQTFATLKAGLQDPLDGMGTAFSSSLFGLAGSLVLGFLDLQASQAQNQFYNDLEEWLSSLTRLGGTSPLVEGDASMPAYVQALLEQTAESLDTLQRTMTRSEEDRRNANSQMAQLTDKLAMLTDQMSTEQSLMTKLADNQSDLKPVLTRLADAGDRTNGAMDDATKTHIRNLDVYMARLLEETVNGRGELVSEFRNEIKILARTLAAATKPQETRPTPTARPVTPQRGGQGY